MEALKALARVQMQKPHRDKHHLYLKHKMACFQAIFFVKSAGKHEKKHLDILTNAEAKPTMRGSQEVHFLMYFERKKAT